MAIGVFSNPISCCGRQAGGMGGEWTGDGWLLGVSGSGGGKALREGGRDWVIVVFQWRVLFRERVWVGWGSVGEFQCCHLGDLCIFGPGSGFDSHFPLTIVTNFFFSQLLHFLFPLLFQIFPVLFAHRLFPVYLLLAHPLKTRHAEG